MEAETEVLREYGCEYGCPERFTKFELLQHMLNCPRHEIESKQAEAAILRMLEAESLKAEEDAADPQADD